MIDLRCGKWEDVLADVGECDAVICDPPYSKRTHEGHAEGVSIADHASGTGGRDLSYAHWTADDVSAFVRSWAPRNRGWFVCFSDHVLVPAYEAAFKAAGLTSFAPLGAVIRGMTVRQQGDGPSSWTLWVNVARPKSLSRWGTPDGGYSGGPGERCHVGGKPLWLMRALVRAYSRTGQLVADPCAGGGTTLLAAAIEGRRAVGAERDIETYELAKRRIDRGYTPSLDLGA